MKRIIKKDFWWQLFLTIFLAFSALAVIFPLLYAVSLSFQEPTAIYNIPPKIIPTLGTDIEIELSYDDPNVSKEQILQDTTVAFFGSYFKHRVGDINNYEIYVSVNDKYILQASTHQLHLEAEYDHGLYKGATFSPAVIMRKDNYIEAMNNIGYSYNPEGLKVNPVFDVSDDEISLSTQTILVEKYELTRPSVRVYTKKSSVISKLKNYVHYLNLPKYIFKDFDFIAKYGLYAFLFNTILMVVVACVTQIGLCALTAFPLAVLFPKKTSKYLMNFFLITMMVPFVCIMIPQLVMLKNLGMYNNYAVMIFPWFLPAPFYIILYTGFFERIPKSFFEAARIDGAGAIYMFTKICMPMSKPIISLIAIQTFISGWTDFFWYFLSTKDMNLWTLNLALFNMSGSLKTNVSMGIAVVVVIPIFLITLVFSRQIKQSVMSSGIKE